jgi:hydrogenase/urease accessory protein HupE
MISGSPVRQRPRLVAVPAYVLGTLVMLLFGIARPVSAHEVRPALLQVAEQSDHSLSVLWKQPAAGEFAVHLVPQLSGGGLDEAPVSVRAAASYVIKEWRIPAGRAAQLDGQALSIEGLEYTLVDALVTIQHADGSTWRGVLTPARRSMILHTGSLAPTSVSAFLSLGVVHVLTGFDHLLFVFGLLLLVDRRWGVLKTITAFTVAHSVTLAAVTLDHVPVSTPLLNAEIALSILFLGPEILRRRRGGTSLTIQHPWAVAFAFGLLHGYGFASGLSAAGLPRDAVIWGLLAFNVGVELGQLMFVAMMLWLIHAFRVLEIQWPRPLQLAPAYLVGTVGAFWTLQRVSLLLAGPG